MEDWALSMHVPDKLFFRIGEVASLLGLKPHVIRYWESEFPVLRPRKNTTNQRRYTRFDVLRVGLVHHLLHKNRYSIEGARRVLKTMDLSNDGIERQLDLLAATGREPPDHDVPGATGPLPEDSSPRKRPAPEAAEPRGSFLEQQQRLEEELGRTQAQLKAVIAQNAELDRRLRAAEEELKAVQARTRESLRRVLRVLDETPPGR